MTVAIYIKRPPRHSGEIGLFPVDDDGTTLLHQCKGQVEVEIRRRRNPRHHRLYWGGIVRFLQEHVEGFQGRDKDDISDMIKIGTGLCKKFIDSHTGQVFYRPKSIAWGAMDQTKFNEFFDNAAHLIVNRWMPDNTPEEIKAEILLMVDGPIGRVA